MSPFGPLIPPQPSVYFRNRLLLPSSAPRNANISPVLSTLRILSVATGVYYQFHRTTHCSLSTTHFSSPFVFIILQIPFPATPFVSHPSKTPGGVWGCTLPILNSVALCRRLPRPGRGYKSDVLRTLQPLCPLFALSSVLVPFVFRSLQPLFAKYLGGGGIQLQLPAQTTRGHAGACPLHNSSRLRVNYALAPFEKLPTASASVLYTSKTVRSLVICRTS